jgi:hypothetical protein
MSDFQRLLLGAAILLIGAFNAVAQQNDFGIWSSIAVQHKLSSRWSAGLGGQVRMNRNLSTIDLAFIETGAQYVLRKNLRASLSYRFIRKNELENWSTRHGLLLDLTARKKVKPFEFTLRSRLQARMEDFVASSESGSPDLFLRYRLLASYAMKGRLEPFFSFEAFQLLQSLSEPYLEGDFTRFRYEAGFKYGFDRNHSLGLSYMIQRNRVQLSTDYVVCAGYEFGF